MERVGFIGLGIMGQGMAHNLLKAGFPLTVWNRTASRTEPFVTAGAVTAATPAAVAADCDITFICVSDTPDVEAVVLGDGGVLEGARPGSLVMIAAPSAPPLPKNCLGPRRARRQHA